MPAGEPETFVHLAQSVLALEGVPVWSRELELFVEEFEDGCPRCGAPTLVLPGGHTDDGGAELHPARLDELTGTGARIHAMALEAGHDRVAEWTTRLFGHATCPACRTRFSVPERVADRSQPS